jgi:hypothetical protein
MDEFDPILTQCGHTQVDDSHVSQAGGDHQNAETDRVGEMTFVEVKPAAFLIGEESFDLEAFSGSCHY